MKVLVTGSLGLVGSEAVRFYLDRGHTVIGVDNNMRSKFFGPEGSGLKNDIEHENYVRYHMDISGAGVLVQDLKPDAIIHCAAQPSHDWAAKDPVTDFNVNAYGTLILLEACRHFCPDAVFIQVSTNKVYGDRPNKLKFEELPTRYEADIEGISESMSVDDCTHSLFGVSKLSGDLLAQEYGRYFDMKVGIFRCGCITGRAHAGVEMHGFLSYLVRCSKENKTYKIYGYKGKQVRDNIHAFDLVNAFDHFIQSPRCGEVYNMGGGRHSNISVLEAIDKLGVRFEYVNRPRVGDHIWYISDVTKFKSHYPKWSYTYSLEDILEDLISA